MINDSIRKYYRAAPSFHSDQWQMVRARSGSPPKTAPRQVKAMERYKKPMEEPETDPQAEKKAVALQYDQARDRAPRVTAKGRGYVAENILAAAQRSTVPVYQNKTLVNMLMALELDREIPPELYHSIAEVMAYIYRMDRARGERQQEKKA